MGSLVQSSSHHAGSAKMFAVDVNPRQDEEGQVQGTAAQSFAERRVGFGDVEQEVDGGLGSVAAATGKHVGMVVFQEDASRVPPARCCHRGRPSARRHARVRRQTRRCETAWRQQEESRLTASAAPPQLPCVSLWARHRRVVGTDECVVAHWRVAGGKPADGDGGVIESFTGGVAVASRAACREGDGGVIEIFTGGIAVASRGAHSIHPEALEEGDGVGVRVHSNVAGGDGVDVRCEECIYRRCRN